MNTQQTFALTRLLIQEAKVRQEDGVLEVDDNAAVSMVDNPADEGGAYVAAWLWVPFTDEMYRACGTEPPGGAV